MFSVCPSEERFGRECIVIPVDFSDGFDIYSSLADQLSDLDIGVLGKGLDHQSKLITAIFSNACSQQCRISIQGP